MGFSLIAKTIAGGTANTVTTSPIDTTGADLLVLVVVFSTDGDVPVVSDSKGNTWTGLTQSTSSFAGLTEQILYSRGGPVGSGHTATVAGLFDFPAVYFLAVSGSAAVPFDKQSTATGTTVTSLAPGSITPSADNCLCVTGVGTAASTITAPAGYTGDVTNFTAGHMGLGGAYLIQTAAAATNPSWSFGIALSAAASVSCFLAAPPWFPGPPRTRCRRTGRRSARFRLR